MQAFIRAVCLPTYIHIFFEAREACVFGSKKGNKSLVKSVKLHFDVTVHVVASNPISSGYICEVQAEGGDGERYTNLYITSN